MANWAQFNLQDPASPIMSHLLAFHDHAILVLIVVLSIVGYALFSLTMNTLISRYTLDAQLVETVWTVVPTVTLLFLAFPSLFLLYLMDEVADPCVSFKAIGHQWYWSYEYSDFNNLSFDSYMLPESDLNPGEFRLLEVDHRTVLPMNVIVRAMVTSADVIHSWAIPALGIKVDAIPGRLNQIGFISLRPGVFYGQCSEMCGAGHSFMPIALEFVDAKTFTEWVTKNLPS
uniref:Cytochrome c oxidase subunit 2 n=1 Tax=Paralvinella hessleri TaxID=36111 RepID=A0A6H0ENA7_9ANNE|nr:cytochrome c oxidase subunit II [Paralvinella hessleri]